MKVRDIMSSPVVTVSPQERVGEVARLMLDQGLSGLPVVDAEGQLVGMVTQTDLVAKHARPHVPLYLGILGLVVPIETQRREEEMRRVLAVRAQDLMSDEVTSVGPDADLEDAATMMVDHGVNPLPVIENGRLVGIVSRHDILRLLVLEEEDADESSPAS